MPHGGARKGAGRKPKALSDKLANNNPGRRPLTKLAFDNGTVMEPPKYLQLLIKKNRSVSSPLEIFDETVKELEPTDCLKYMTSKLIADYAMARYYLYCAQYELSLMHTVTKNEKTGMFHVSGFADAVIKMQKNVLDCWHPIWEIVERNSEKKMLNPEEDMIIGLNANRKRKKPKGERPDEIYELQEDSGESTESGGV